MKSNLLSHLSTSLVRNVRLLALTLGIVSAPMVMAQQNFLGQAVIDGVGSLVDPGNKGQCQNYGNYGCSRDIVTLQTWNMRSAGVFQVLNNGDCPFVRVEGLSQAWIIVKGWSESYPGELLASDASRTVYGATSLPANVSMPAGWSVVHVSSVNPLTTATDVKLTCQSGGFFQLSPGNQLQSASKATIAGFASAGLVKDENSSEWGGNGSLITLSNNQSDSDSAAGYGRTRDTSKTYGRNRFSTNLFQILSNGISCKSVRVSSSYAGGVAEVRVKTWSAKNWAYVPGSPAPDQFGFRTVSLPINVSMLGEGYTVLKVDLFHSATKQSINVDCN